MNIPDLHQLFLISNSVSTDTRSILNGALFFALKGDNFNGNEFAEKAIENGASYAIIDEIKFKINGRCILVDDSLKCLQELANFHRKYLGVKIIALTGSNGKTTTKELINVVLSKKYKTISTKGNLNNHIGVPLTLLSMKKTDELGIVEMGANHQKEIEFLCTIAEPDFGLITNFGKAHLEGFGGVEGVIKGKSEMYEHLLSYNKHVFLNADDNIQLEKLQSYTKKFGFSQVRKDFYNIQLKNADPFVKLALDGITISSNLIGQYNFTNIGFACLIGKYFDVPLREIKSAIESYVPSNNRSQIIKKGSNKIILDAYNANPTSMKAALENFSNLSDSNKIAILGDMYELGESEFVEHQKTAELASRLNIDTIYLVGNLFHQSKIDDTRLTYFKDFVQLANYLKSNKVNNATILIKASRGMALERALDYL